ncbi:MAG: hypothetical protein ACLTUY_12450 [Roseburia sp.]
MFGDDRVILISDAMRATGMADGTYELGGQTVYKKGRFATLAKSIGMEKTIGSLTPGARADVLLLNKKYELERVLLFNHLLII